MPQSFVVCAEHNRAGSATLIKLLRRLFGKRPRSGQPLSHTERARQLIAAIDAGGIPLDPAIVKRIAEGFGLEVSRHARTEETIERIRAALTRCDQA